MTQCFPSRGFQPFHAKSAGNPNVEQFVSLRRVTPAIPLHDLRQITTFFPKAGYRFSLDPSYEPERHGFEGKGVPPPDPEKTATFAILQKYNRHNLIVPEGASHMWHAAMQWQSVKLTALGEHYRRLAVDERL